MTNWIYIIAIIIVIVLAVLYFLPSLTSKLTSTNDGPFLLAGAPAVFQSSETNHFIDSGDSTVQGYFYILPLDRTPTAMKCNEPGYPSCEDGRFQTCICETASCKNCTFNGYSNLLSIGDIVNLQMLGTPDAGRPGKAMAQLTVKTESPVDSSGNSLVDSTGSSVVGGTPKPVIYVEVINLPPIPIQKWILITIARSGRRYDVYYNNELVSSSKTMYMISGAAEKTKTTVVGSARLSGYASSMNKYNYKVSSSDVSSYYKKSSDTRGAPLIAQELPSIAGSSPQGSSAGPTLPGFVIDKFPIPSLCGSGSCLDPPTTRPANPMYEWTTPYA